AGAVCASAHLFSKNSENYFKKLILMSGSINGLLDVYENTTVDSSTRIAAQQMGCFKQRDQANHTYIFSCLLNQTIENITKYSDNVTYRINMPNTLGFNIILDDTVFFNGTLEEKIQTGNMKYHVDVLFGMPNNGGSFFLPILKNATQFGCTNTNSFNYNNDTCKLSENNYTSFWKYIENPLNLGNQSEIVKNIYNSSKDGIYRQDAINVLTDVSYRCHMVEFARKVNIKTNGYIYGYYFNTSSSNNNWPQWMVSTHGDELDYAFGLPFRYPGNYTQRLEQEKMLSENVMNMIKNFTVLEGSSLGWMDFVDKSRKGISINADFYQDRRISLIDDMETSECRKILKYLPKYFSLYEPLTTMSTSQFRSTG
uniref:COesterase domain-containing protein n=1 Tax=Parastrongyloides trichosuri TaxID=131310 RepID=A0A0N4ZLT6_PARTI